MEWTSWTVSCLLSVIGAACAGLGDPSTPHAAPGRSPSPAASPGGLTAFVPTPEVVGGEARLALTFPDGSEALIAYPAILGLAEMGAQPDVDLTWDGRWIGAIVFSHGGPVDRLFSGPDSVAVHQVEDRAAEEWPAHPRGGRHQATTRWLVFRLTSWTVHVPMDERMDAEEVIRTVHPRETEDGFVTVQVEIPAELPEGFGEAGGSQIAFGDQNPLPDFIDPRRQGVLLQMAPTECRGLEPTIELRGSYGSACPHTGFFLNGTTFTETDTSRRLLRQAIEEIDVVAVRPPG